MVGGLEAVSLLKSPILSFLEHEGDRERRK